MIKVLELPIHEDLAPLYTYLRSHRVPIRIIEAGGKQEVWVLDDRAKSLTLQLYEQYRNDPKVRAHLGDFQVEMEKRVADATTPKFNDWLISFWRVPVTWCGIIAIVVLMILADSPIGQSLIPHLMITDFAALGARTVGERWDILLQTLASGEIWRLITPAFLHANLPHLLFNAMWFWYLGIRIERFHGSRVFLTLMVVTAIGSNLGQYLAHGPNFVGMSGAIYGFFGFAGWQTLFHPKDGAAIPQGILIFSLIWLLVGFTELSEWMAGGPVANTAHLTGLLWGIFFAWLYDLFYPRRTPV